MHETSKTLARRLQDHRFLSRWFVGEGIDIGCGEDFLGNYMHLFPLVTSIRPWDMADGDAQIMDGVPDGYFDFVHSSNCLEHLHDPQMGLNNWMRILKPGGHLIFTVPDEDMYEQGSFPSIHNKDHKWTFTIYKQQTWSTSSVNVMVLLSNLGSQLDIRKLEVLDHFYDFARQTGDQTLLPETEAFIEVVIRKRPVHEVARGGRIAEYAPRPSNGIIFLEADGRVVPLREIRNKPL